MSAATRAPLRSNRPVRRAALLAAGAAAAALTLSACGSGGTSGGGGDTGFVTGNNGIDTVAQGKRTAAPDLSGRTIDGGTLDVASYKGKVVVVNVWGSWCSPCRAEGPNFAKVSKEYADQGVQFVGINTRDTSTTPARNFEKQQGITYPSLYDPTGKLMLRFQKGTLNPQLIPSTLVIDRDGKIAARALQALSEENLVKMIKPVLAEK
ncbi:TlpA family protein disulfide reductase [Streptomyces mangrovisoli]|uniref:Redoxin domain-containing protein n=1 Tax=Streptomyces mangrovisoli TaxID=1428628 RepID=A0A1J4NWS2_9ACTN|nr:TlpA disulfide reductase family protein [Streptomyces mangrovisoli]OIJ66760.1 redoxin domain-containing protein [Streptomyces mangrovisoli]